MSQSYWSLVVAAICTDPVMAAQAASVKIER
jgi:hypothetical protein